MAYHPSLPSATVLAQVCQGSQALVAVAVGSIGFVEDMKARLGYAGAGRRVQAVGDTQMLREPEFAYGDSLRGEKQCLSLENTVYL